MLLFQINCTHSIRGNALAAVISKLVVFSCKKSKVYARRKVVKLITRNYLAKYLVPIRYKRSVNLINAVISLSLITVIVLDKGVASAFAMDRWYNKEQVKTGNELFLKNCAECHGNEAQGILEPQNGDNENFIPSPALDGSAHAWHHSIDVLRRTIREGGAKLGGKMPAVGENFSDVQLDSLIASFQSKWPDEIYGRWEKINTKSLLRVSNTSNSEKNSSNDPLVLLRRLMPESNIDDLTKTPAKELLRVRIDGHYAYLTKDGRYALIGSLIDLSDGIDLTEQTRQADRIRSIEGYPEKDMIVFPSNGQEKSVITVFTDSSCPYCKKLHQEIPILQEAGITVRYIPFPRGGPDSPGSFEMRSVWCDGNRTSAMNIVMGIEDGNLGDGDCDEANAVSIGYNLGNELGVRGTPSIVLENGKLLPGYVPAIKLISLAIQANHSSQ